MFDIGRAVIEASQRALVGAGTHPRLRQCPNILKPRRPGDGPAVFPHQLHAVVVDGVMTGRDHAAPIDPQGAGGKVDFLRATEADVDDLGAEGLAAPGKGGFQFRRRKANIPAHDHGLRPEVLGKGPADPFGEFGGKLRFELAADVVGFKAIVRIHHHFLGRCCAHCEAPASRVKA